MVIPAFEFINAPRACLDALKDNGDATKNSGPTRRLHNVDVYKSMGAKANASTSQIAARMMEKEVKDILEVLGQEKLIQKRNCTARAMPGNFHELAMCLNGRSCRQFDASNREGHNSTNLNVRK